MNRAEAVKLDILPLPLWLTLLKNALFYREYISIIFMLAMSKGITYMLNVITLAAWLSVTLGAWIGFRIHQDWTVKFALKPKPLSVLTSVDIVTHETVEAITDEVPTEVTVEPPATTSPAPPALPNLAPMAELPEIPEIPVSVIRKTAPKVATTQQSNKSNTTAPSTATSLSLGVGAGRQPSPTYPLQARRNNQQGTVVVEFLVGVDGKVLNAWLKSPCPYDSLNNAALSTIRNRWSFPEGPARRYKISIIFQLN